VYDTDEVEARRFENDWVNALDLGLQKLIMKRDDDAGVDEDGDGICDEVEEVKDVMWDCHDLIIQLFDFYACVSGNFGAIGLNQWAELVEDLELDDATSKLCRKADMDTLFIAVNAKSKNLERERAKQEGGKASKSGGPKEDEKALNRVEFMVCLVNVAINKYVLNGEIKDVSEALCVLLTQHIEPRVDKRIFSDYNLFRQRIYQPIVVDVLLKNESSLRNLFAVAAGGDPGGPSASTAKLLSLEEWKALLKALHLVGLDITDRDARLCFACSRMAVVDGATAKGGQKENNLPFEGFLEALCRLSLLKALPTDAELEELGCSDAGIFMQKLQEGSLPEDFMDALEEMGSPGQDAYMSFMSCRGLDWGAESHPMPLERCLHHTICCMVRTVEEGAVAGTDNMTLTPAEVKNWAKGAGLIKGL